MLESTPLLGSLLVGRYRLDDGLGAGGMGVVFRAVDTQLGRPVAVKLLRPDSDPDGGRARLRLLREARSAAALTTPFAVTVHDVHEATGHEGDEFDFIVMELVDGKDLHEVLAGSDGGLEVNEARRVVTEVLTGLVGAHSAGIVHRDIKPANVLLTSQGSVKITDFGIARSSYGHDRLTTEGFFGSPPYMAPEAFVDSDASALPPADIYAVGVLAYALVTGRSPYASASGPVALWQAKSRGPLPRPSEVRSGLPDGVDRFVEIMTQPDPARRPTDADAALSCCAQLWPQVGAASPTRVVPVERQPVDAATLEKAEPRRATVEVRSKSAKRSELILPVELDEASLAQLGWQGDARVKIAIDEAYETDSGKMMLEYAFNLSATLQFDPALWVDRYQRSRSNSFAPGLLFILECEGLGEPLIMQLLTDTMQKLRRPLRKALSGTLTYTTRRVRPDSFRARILAFDGLEAAFQEYGFDRSKGEIDVEIVDEFGARTVVPRVDRTRAFLTDSHVVAIASGVFTPGEQPDLAAMADESPWFDPADGEPAELPMPDIITEFVDSDGFPMIDLHALFGLNYYYDPAGARPGRECRWFLHRRWSLSSLPSQPTKVILRIVEDD